MINRPVVDYYLLCYDYKEIFQTTTREVGGEWFIKKINANPPPIKRRQLSKIEQIKEDKIKEELINANAHWNDWKFPLHRNKLEWVYQKR